MSKHYCDQRASLYLVAIIEDSIVGGCGIAGFNGSREICELRKLFLLKESRGLGVGKALVVKCLEYARQKGYKECYQIGRASCRERGEREVGGGAGESERMGERRDEEEEHG